MPLNTKEILIASADQTKTTGAVYVGDVVDTIPADFTAAVAALANLNATGYLGEDGITIASSLSLTDFREMNRGVVRRGVDSPTATITHTELQFMNEDILKMKFGEDNVSVVAANTTHGKQLRVKVGAELPPISTFAYKLKDGDTRAIAWVPRGQITNGVDLTASPSSMSSLPVEVSCYDDGDGGLFYIFFDDGEVVTVVADTTLSALTLGSLTLSPTFDKNTTEYATSTTDDSNAVTATATASGAGVVIVANGNSIASGDSVTWGDGDNTVTVTVTNGTATKTYTVTVTKGE